MWRVGGARGGAYGRVHIVARPNGCGYGSRCRLHQALEIRLGKIPEMRGLGRPTAELGGARDRCV